MANNCPDDMDFSLRMTEITYEPGKNTVTSPFSLVSALLMVLAGAKGETRAEMLKVLFQQEAKDDDEKFKSFLNDLIEKLTKFFQDNKDVLSNANMTYCHQNFPIKKDYMDFLNQKFSAIAKQLDFTDKARALAVINEDVKKATKDMIPKLLEDISPAEKFILINAIYFKGLWEKPFPKESVHDADFFKSDGQTVKVKMMRSKRDLRITHGYNEEMKVKAIVLPYTSGSISMLLLLPDEGNSVGNLLKQLNKDKLKSILSSLHNGEVRVVMMPKFKIESGHEIRPHMEKLGVRAAFQGRLGEFADISDEPMCISRIIQKAVIEVDEEGTTAAAATAIMMMRCALIMNEFEFIANRPFIFMLISKGTNHVLFSGVVEDPTQ